jgi:putative FmdB family regulatory protein
MPIYEYRCSACGFEKDALQKMADAPLVDCPNCGKPALVKLVSAAGFQLKGSGWYATDFKNSGKAKTPDKPKSGGAATTAEGTGSASAAAAGSAGGSTETSAGKTEAPATAKSDTTAPAPTGTPGAGD